jgi:hypothetical protein
MPKSKKRKKKQPKQQTQAAKKEPKPTLPTHWGTFLMWAGCVGVAISLLGGLQTIIDFADWARWLVLNWQHYNHLFWSGLLRLIGVKVEPPLSLLLTFVISLALASVSALFLELRVEPPASLPRPKEKWWQLWLWTSDPDHQLRYLEGIAASCIAAISYSLVIDWYVFGRTEVVPVV